MRAYGLSLLSATILACGSTGTTSSTVTDSDSTGSTTQSPTTGGPVTSSSTGDFPTGGSDGMTASGSTADTTSTTSPTSTSETTVDMTSTTMPVTSTTSTGPDTTTTGPDTTTTTGPDTTTTTGPDSTSTGEESTTGVEELCPCPDLEVPLDDGVFVLSLTAELWKFFPMDNSFQKLGPLSCDLPPNTFSMAVDRLGYAWVQYSGGQLRTIDVTNVANCTDPGYVVGQQGITNFGMAFVSNSQSDACDRIYGNRANFVPEGNAVSDFFAIDPVSLNVQQIGKSDYGTAEVTGTGDGRAFLFAGANPAKLVEIDKATGQKLAVTPLPGVELGSAWAFAFFGGDFYFFTNSQNGPGSEVTHIDYDDSDMNGQQDITVVVADAPISIVGAGVSTCAPTAPQ
ncbi:hypothetical protein [Nannocystis punicea]|uniref:Uncharacterized protein n=1 Tax=Nannocystis punicea TaxID=2995304 RepID=A0ABY7HJN2_9BACT|nr:hypothetical protein [Nannocystis poenicansa]WAS99257.1 hypothetical protein O0S08_24275 [Nannocystis poenicansa]